MHSRICMPLAALAWLACAAPAFAESVTLFRVFLNDGTAIVSYGEYARVGDRLVFSMPIGAVDANVAGEPNLHVVNLPVSAVNWTATEKYAESARHSHYMANGAESDYAALAGDVAATLNAIVLAKDPQGAAEHGGRRSPPAGVVAERPLRLPRRRRARNAGPARRSDLRAAGSPPAKRASPSISWRRRPPRDDARSHGDAQSADGRRGHHAGDCRGEGHRHRRRSRVDSSRRCCGHRQPAKRAAARAGRAPTRRWAIRAIAEEARIEKTLRRVDVDHVEARGRCGRRAPMCGPWNACSRPSAGATRSWAGSGRRRSTR